MGRAKQWQMEQQEEVGRVVGMLVREGAITGCEIHEGVYIDNWDSEAAERVQEMLEQEGLSADDAEALVQSAMEEAGEECGYCANNRERD